MATENLELKKPAQEDFYNVDDFNENFQKIDDFAGRKDNPHNVTKAQVGLGNVDNTSDMDKPVSEAQYVKIQEAMAIGTTAQVNLISHMNDKNNPHGVTKEQVGLSNVDNTSDEDKPISFAQGLRMGTIESEMGSVSSNLLNHINSRSNPHEVTKAQVGLGNVPNVATNNQTPTYTEASTLTGLTSGEKLSVAFGKIKKAITDLIAHVSKSATSSVAGHVKITDSVTSSASDTAASAKAVKTAYDIAQNVSYKLLKTQAINIKGMTYDGSRTFYSTNVSGINLDAYSDVLLHFEGTITNHKSTEAYPEQISMYIGFTDAEQTLLHNSGCAMTLSTTSTSVNFSRAIEFSSHIEDLDRRQYKFDNGNLTSDAKISSKIIHYYTQTSGNVYGAKELTNNDIWFVIQYEMGKYSNMDISGTITVYGKEKVA